MEQIYCCLWLDATRKAQQVIPSERAESMHRMGEPYTVVFYVQNRVRYAVTLSKNGVTVRFYDEEQMPDFYYDYQPADADRMFLRSCTKFFCEKGKIVRKLVYDYDPRSLLTKTDFDVLAGTKKVTEATVDLSNNWERFPEFEDYDHLLISRTDLPMI